MLSLMIDNPGEKPVSPKKSCILADAAMFCGLAYAQALGQRQCIVLPKMALPQSRHRAVRQSTAGFTAGLAAVPRPPLPPPMQFAGLTMQTALGALISA
ncbi:hypothetical protein TMS3_0121105 [Pseudomonas taeanensis MS-3]|uniref:Uncharacterized protein n=1 Tax=Pseudomonas taeanensis MS-3 TaxID=1395571 RepID=A0A0A1YGE7_9PSED|nr:hypothetical protein TMS3_0121105 [Pseudomonas taeanensis MS-3]